MSGARNFNMADAIAQLFGYETEALRNLDGARLVTAAKVGDRLVVETDRGTLTGSPEGDCCSCSWFESVECDAPAGALFTGLDLDEARDLPEWSDGSERKVYFGTLFTDRGRITWEMRNESNGYYGGYITWSWVPSTTEVTS